MELTIEAIENDLLLAEQNIGRPGYDLHLTRAKIRATLMAGYVATGTVQQTVELLPDLGPIPLADQPIEDEVQPQPIEPDDEDDIFADAKKERRK